MCIFLGQKKYGIWGDFSEKFQVLCKNPDEVTQFDGTSGTMVMLTTSSLPGSQNILTCLWNSGHVDHVFTWEPEHIDLPLEQWSC
jgi:hypothetical protein